MSDLRKIFDISQWLRPGVPVWPGDTGFSESPTWQMGDDCPVNVHQFSLSTHCGTHADAPLHYDPAGEPIGAVGLSAYLGRCRVLDVTQWAGNVSVDMLVGKDHDLPPRVLFKTCVVAPKANWDAGFRAIRAEVIEWLAQRGVVLVGTDAASLDPQDAKTLHAHQAVRQHRMAILEGLVFDEVSEGDYELIALPLRLQHLDASPVRAILREL